MRCIVNGLVAEYEDAGHGDVILMLHGWKDSLHTFDEIAIFLADSHRIIRLDLPGFGGSEPPPADWKLDDYVGFVKDFLAKLDIRPDTLVGHSFGGRITVKGVATGVLQPKKIVLISSAGVARRQTFKNVILTVLAKIGRVVTAIPPFSFWKQKIRRKLYEAIGSDYFRAGVLRGTFLNIIKEDLSTVAKAITIPALILWGEDDATTPLSEGKKLHGIIRTSTFRIIPHAGHFVHQEKPDEISGIIREFIPLEAGSNASRT